jgi:large subunit ribosomal protein L25
MAEINLVAEPGRTIGSASSRRLRAAGRIPAVVYGHGSEGVSVSVDGRDLRHALSGAAGLNQLLNIKIGTESHLAMARAIQRHPVRHTVLLVDFQVVRRDEVIAADVPIVIIGEATEVEREKGIIEQLLTSLSINATPALIPTGIEIDISALTIGEGIRVGDIALPAGVTTEIAPDEIVVLASIPRATVEEGAEAAEGAEGVAGEEGAEAGTGAGSEAGAGSASEEG